MERAAAERRTGHSLSAPGDALVLADGSRPRVLLCEDCQAARALTATLIERLGCVVDVAGDGEEAVEKVRHRAYDAIVMDIEMPILDGLAAARSIRAIGGRAAATPIVALSGYAGDAACASSASGPVFDAMLAKPMQRRDLQRTLAAVLPASAPPRSAGDTAEGPDCRQVLDPARLRLVLGDLARSQRRALLALAADEIARLVGELETAGGRGDPHQVRRLAHQINGTAANFAACRLSRLAVLVEADCRDGLPGDIGDRVAQLGACARETVIALRSERLSGGCR